MPPPDPPIRFWRSPQDAAGSARPPGFLTRRLGVEGLRAAAGGSLLLGSILLIGEGNLAIGIILVLLSPFLFIHAMGASRRGSWVEVDRGQGVIREHRPEHWAQPQEAPIAAFTSVDIAELSDEGSSVWLLILTRRDSRFGLEILSAALPDGLREPALRLAAATGLPLGDTARRHGFGA